MSYPKCHEFRYLYNSVSKHNPYSLKKAKRRDNK